MDIDDRHRETMESMAGELNREEDVPNIVRTVVERGWSTQFSDVLQEQSDRKSREINRICNRFYGEFLGSVHQLLESRESVGKLKTGIDSLKDQVIKVLILRNYFVSLSEIFV